MERERLDREQEKEKADKKTKKLDQKKLDQLKGILGPRGSNLPPQGENKRLLRSSVEKKASQS